MGEPTSVLIIPVGFNPSDELRSVTVDVNDYLHTVLTTGLTGGGMGEPVGPIAVIAGYNPSGELRTVELDADDNLLITLLGGAANQILSSDGTKFGAITLADVLEAAILTTDGDILIRTGGAATRLAKGNDHQQLGLASGVPTWQDGVKKVLTAAGDIVYASAANVLARLAKGSDADVLTLASGVPSWAAPAVGGYTECCRVYNNAHILIANNTVTAVTFNSERWDTDTMHDTVSNTNRITCKTAGKYHFTAGVAFQGHATGYRSGYIRKNGTSTLGRGVVKGYAAQWAIFSFGCDVDLAVDDYVELTVYQNSGGNLYLYYSADYSIEFMCHRIA